MPRVRVRVAHINIAGRTHSCGEEASVEGEVASYLSAAGLVEIVRGADPETPERNAVETTSRRRTRRESHGVHSEPGAA